MSAWVALWAWLVRAPLLQPQPIDSVRYFESTTLMAMLDDGTYLQGLVAISNIGVNKGNGACRLLMARPSGKPTRLDASVDAGKWHYSAVPVPTMAMGPCRLAATASGMQLDAALESLQISMTLAASAHAVVPPGMPLHVADSTYETEVLVPFAPAEVVLVQGDSAPQTLHGFGYADHARSTALPKHLGQGAVRLRAPACGVVLYARWEGNAVQGYVWQKSAGAAKALQGWHMALPNRDAAGNTLTLTPPEGSPWTVHMRKRWFREAPLEDYGLVGKLVGAWMGSVVNETYAVDLEGGGCAHGAGILEVDHNG